MLYDAQKPPSTSGNLPPNDLCHKCGKHKNNKSEPVSCSECKKFVCEKYSTTVATCETCLRDKEYED